MFSSKSVNVHIRAQMAVDLEWCVCVLRVGGVHRGGLACMSVCHFSLALLKTYRLPSCSEYANGAPAHAPTDLDTLFSPSYCPYPPTPNMVTPQNLLRPTPSRQTPSPIAGQLSATQDNAMDLAAILSTKETGYSSLAF